MSEAMRNYLFANLLPAICVAAAVYLSYNDKDGWGWILVLAFLTAHTFGKDD